MSFWRGCFLLSIFRKIRRKGLVICFNILIRNNESLEIQGKSTHKKKEFGESGGMTLAFSSNCDIWIIPRLMPMP